MSESSKKPSIPNKVVDLMVSNIFNKNGVNEEKVKKSLTPEQKKMLRELVEDLSQQVNTFMNSTPKKQNKEQ